MRISCDNCGATYRIPEHKLVRQVNKATCRKCGSAIIIKRAGETGGGGDGAADLTADRERTQITSQAELQAKALAQSGGFDSAGPPTEISPKSLASSTRALHTARSPVAAAPTPHGVAPSSGRAHDPSGDLSIVMMACFAAAFGALVLASSTSTAQTFIGLFITLWSATTSLFVLVTGNRGRKEAGVVLSLVIGLVVAGVFAGGLHLLRGGALPDQLADAAATPAKAAADKEAADKEAADKEAADKEAADKKAADKAAAVAAAESPKPVIRAAAPVTRAEPKPVTPAPSIPATRTATGIPLTVLDTMIKSNRSVKTCFALYREETGSLPSGRITVTLTVNPTGRVAGAGIESGAYDGSSLDSCLGGAIGKIQFPAFDGSAKTYRYPFIL